ncbi:MAG: DUF4157 domain-containing protein [Bacteroidetes bacterium]|nr:DUF4157 domain-containing protein [Bacteroidota bacterium]
MGTSKAAAQNDIVRAPVQTPAPAATLSEPTVAEGAGDRFIQRALAAATGGGVPPPSTLGALLGSSAPGLAAGTARRLQREYGNQFVGRMVQAKLTVNEPGDRYEAEAESVADAVVRAPSVAGSEPVISDARETAPVVHRAPISPAPSSAAQPVPAGTAARIDAMNGGGQPLAGPVRSSMEGHFGQDFGGVRIHTDNGAAQAAKELNARAFTIGNNIAFASGSYAPDTSTGRHLLAHELTHVVQQTGSVRLSPDITPAPAGMVQRGGGDPPSSTPAAGPGGAKGGSDAPGDAAAPAPATVGVYVDVPIPDLTGAGTKEGGGKVLTEKVLVGAPADSATTITLYGVPMSALSLTKEDAEKGVTLDKAVAAGVAPGECSDTPAVPDTSGVAADPTPPSVPASGATNATPAPKPVDPATAPSPISPEVSTLYTPDGAPVSVVASTGEAAIVSTYTKFAVGAGSTSLLEAHGQVILIDAGISTSPNITTELEAEIAATTMKLLRAKIGNRPIAQVLVTHAHSDHIAMLDKIATEFPIQSIRMNDLQLKYDSMQKMLEKVRQGIERYKANLADTTRTQLEAGKQAWLDANLDLLQKSPAERDAKWREHVDAEVARKLAEVPQAELQVLKQSPEKKLYLEWQPLGKPTEPFAPLDPQKTGSIGTDRVQMAEFSHPELYERATKFTGAVEDDKGIVDSTASNYLVRVGDTQFIVLPDLRRKDYADVLTEFKNAASKFKPVTVEKIPAYRIWDITHHMQAGWMKTGESKPAAAKPDAAPAAAPDAAATAGTSEAAAAVEKSGSSVRASEFSKTTTLLHQFRDMFQPDGSKSPLGRDFAIVSVEADTAAPNDPKSKVSPTVLWILRSLGIEPVPATRGSNVEFLEILSSQGQTYHGVYGAAYAGGRPTDLLLLRTEATLKQLHEAQKQFESTKGKDGLTPVEQMQLAIKKQQDRVAIAKKADADAATAARDKGGTWGPKNENYAPSKAKIADAEAKVAQMRQDLNRLYATRKYLKSQVELIEKLKEEYIHDVDQAIGRSHRDDATAKRSWVAPDPAAAEPGAAKAAELRKTLSALKFDDLAAVDPEHFKTDTGSSNAAYKKAYDALLETTFDRVVVPDPSNPHFDEVALVLVRKDAITGGAEPGSAKATAYEAWRLKTEIDALTTQVEKNSEGTVDARARLLADLVQLRQLLDTHKGTLDQGVNKQFLNDEVQTLDARIAKLKGEGEGGGGKSVHRDTKSGALVETVTNVVKPMSDPAAEAPKDAAPAAAADTPSPDAEAAKSDAAAKTGTGEASVTKSESLDVPKEPSKSVKVTGALIEAANPVMGVVMVTQTISGEEALIRSFSQGKGGVVNLLAGTSHNALGVYVGIQMVRGVEVNPTTFVVMSALDIAQTVTHDYATNEQRNVAIAQSAVRNGVNLGLMIVGGILMRVPNPVCMIAGFTITMLGDTIMEKLGINSFLDRAFSFQPMEVTGLFQDLRTVLDEYRVIVGSLQLDRRSNDDLAKLGVTDPAAFRQAAEKTAEEHRQAAYWKELDVLTTFRSAYARARTGYAGLLEVDQLRDQFLQLRRLAHDDSRQSKYLEKRFDYWMDRDEQNMSMDAMSAEQIRGMEQWSELDDKITDLGGLVQASHPDDVNWKDVSEAERKVSMMISNARYRLDPNASGGYRTTALLTQGSEARRVYEEELSKREHRLTYMRRRLAMASVGESPEIFSSPMQEVMAESKGYPTEGRMIHEPFSPGMIVERLRYATDQYEKLLAHCQLPPGFTAAGVHANGDENARYLAYIDLHQDYKQLLYKVQAVESALKGQREEATKVFLEATSDDAKQYEPQFKQLSDRITALLEQRRVRSEVLTAEEARDRQVEIARNDASDLGKVLDPAGAQTLSPMEKDALATSDMREAGYGAGTANDQLQYAAQQRTQLASGGKIMSGYYRYVGSTSFVVGAPERTVSAADNAIVTAVSRGVTATTFMGDLTTTNVVAVNQAARAILGSRVVNVADMNLVSITRNDVLGNGSTTATGEPMIPTVDALADHK